MTLVGVVGGTEKNMARKQGILGLNLANDCHNSLYFIVFYVYRLEVKEKQGMTGSSMT